MSIKAGDKAAEFALSDQDGKKIQLSALKGKKVLLSFHPLAWTSVCAEQMKSLEKNRNRFEKLNTIALGLSVDTVPSKKAWAKELGIKNTRLLSDFWPHGEVAEKYGVLRSEGKSERALFIIDKQGVIRYIDIHDIHDQPSNEVLRQAIRETDPGVRDRPALPQPEAVALPRGGIVSTTSRVAA